MPLRRTVLTGGRVFDGTGAEPSYADLLIEGDRILDIGTGLDADEAVDVTGTTLLPGFFDCHVHVTLSGLDLMRHIGTPYSYQYYEAMRNLGRTLDVGITTVRDAAGADAGVRQAVRDGLIDGPRMRISVTALSQTGGHCDAWHPSGISTPFASVTPGRPYGVVDGPEAMRLRVREILRAGADAIKVCTTGGVASPGDDPRHAHFRDDELAAMMAEVRAAGVHAMAHAQGPEGIKNAVRAGVRSIEHGVYLDEEGIELMLRHGTWLVPTLSAPLAVIRLAESGGRISGEVLAKAREAAAAHGDSFARAVAAGVKVAMGTDSGVGPHGENLGELPLMEKGGMSPAQVLAATTSSAADLLGMGELTGRLRPGLLADIVVVDGDPYDLTSLSERIREVYKDGRRVRG
ncbi:metal-dependent hydrolase family protein [Streptomyces sp. NRRL S-646]|uniref:metal-dependent hydrolase family protein n=1 Tax=Streptomyces sp. NRRL S-646 TaxID=1463917 RepID=UPI0004C9EEA4|nr:amidohydrolase family protein [Streptomyces sp. NRRL S-646]